MWELWGVALFLFVVGVVSYGWYVFHGGLYGDDWGTASAYRFAHGWRLWTSIEQQAHQLGGRPILAALLPLPFAVLGVGPHAHLALALGLGMFTSLCFYALLRVLGLGRAPAAVISALALVFPWSDSIRLWPTASLNSVAVCFFLMGLAVALLGLEQQGRRAAAYHALAALLYLASVLTYEVAGAAVVLAVVLYLRRAPVRAALACWLVDLVVVVAGLTYSLLRTIPVRHVGTLQQRIADAHEMARESLVMLVWTLVPVHSATKPVQATVLAAVLLIVAVALYRTNRSQAQELRRWLCVAGVSVLAIAAAYFMLLGSGIHPTSAAAGTRANVFAGLAYVALAYALASLLAHLLFRTRPAAHLATLAIACLIAAGYGVKLARDESAWASASRLQQPLIRTIDRTLPHLRSGSTVVTFDYPAQVSPGAPVFVAIWDLTGAVQLDRGNDPTLHAYPVYQGATLACRAGRFLLHLPGSRGNARPPYGRLFFLDGDSAHVRQIRDERECRTALATFRPGPAFVAAG